MKKIAEEYAVNLRYRAFKPPINIPEEGLSPEEMDGLTPDFGGISEAPPPEPKEKPDKTPEEMALEKGMPFKSPERWHSPHLAMELTLWAASKNGWFDFFEGVFKALYGEGKDIADINVLCDIAESVGLPRDEAKEVLEKRSFKKAVDEDWIESRQHGITAIPAFIFGDAKLVHGASHADIIDFLEENNIELRKGK